MYRVLFFALTRNFQVCEWERNPYDSVCVRIVQVGAEDLMMPNTAIAEPAPVRSYINRKVTVSGYPVVFFSHPAAL